MFSIPYGFEVGLGGNGPGSVSFESGAVVVASAPLPADDAGFDIGSGGPAAFTGIGGMAPHSGTYLGSSNTAGPSALPFCVGTIVPGFAGGSAGTPNDALLAAFNSAADAGLEWADFYGIYSGQLPYLALMMSRYTAGAPAIDSISFWYQWRPVTATAYGPSSIPIATMSMPNSPDTISISGPDPATGSFDQMLISWSAAGQTATVVAPAINSGGWEQIAVDAQGKVSIGGVDYDAPIRRAWSPGIAQLFPAGATQGKVASAFDDIVVNYGDDLAAQAYADPTKITTFAPIR